MKRALIAILLLSLTISSGIFAYNNVNSCCERLNYAVTILSDCNSDQQTEAKRQLLFEIDDCRRNLCVFFDHKEINELEIELFKLIEITEQSELSDKCRECIKMIELLKGSYEPITENLF